MSNVWRLHLEADRYLSFVPHDLNFFREKFQCKSLKSRWKTPPVEILGKSKPAPDFALWMTMAPAVSEGARNAINDVANDCVEFLDFHQVKGKNYSIMNVLRCENYLDTERSVLESVSAKYVFRKSIPEVIPPIFKCAGQWDEIFVSTEFAEMMVTQRLRGASLADPVEPTFPLILSKACVNRFPGLIP